MKSHPRLPARPAIPRVKLTDRGVTILGAHYWASVFVDETIEDATTIAVRLEPSDRSKAYAFAHGEWRLLRSGAHVNLGPGRHPNRG